MPPKARTAADLDGRRGPRHDDGRRHAEPLRAQGHPLGMVTGAGGNHPAGADLGVQAGELVVGAAQLEREDRLQILALQEDLVADPGGELGCQGQRCLQGHVVDAGLQDAFDVAVGHQEVG